ncbi:hypothetical protein CMI37_30900 [Candidatus Pacearchaeota archaeon]|nr:hypothetical protein [Candidatus Pacearchaeota archaeon]|tara:strand:+ start:1018 stop:1377 length:360 start_codon:yes stop_codon:yes gene_type:complete
MDFLGISGMGTELGTINVIAIIFILWKFYRMGLIVVPGRKRNNHGNQYHPPKHKNENPHRCEKNEEAISRLFSYHDSQNEKITGILVNIGKLKTSLDGFKEEIKFELQRIITILDSRIK